MDPAEQQLLARSDRRRALIWAAVAAVVAAALVTTILLLLPRDGSPAAVAAARTSDPTASTAAPSAEASATATTTAGTSSGQAGTAAAATTQPDAVDASLAAVPGVPTGLDWRQDPGKDMPLWSPPGSDGGAPITGYRVTLSDLTLQTTTTETWRPGEVGVRHWGCLSNGFPEDQDHYFTFDVAAVNAVGVGPAVTSPQIIGQRC